MVQKIYMAMIAVVAVVAIVVIAYTAVNSTSKEKTPDTIIVSVEKATVKYNDTQTWNANGLPPNAGYIATVRWTGVALVVEMGTANAKGEASSSFVIGPTIATGPVMFRVEVASDPAIFGETPMKIEP